MVAAEAAASTASVTGPTGQGEPLRIGMFGGGTVGGGVYEICEQVKALLVNTMIPANFVETRFRSEGRRLAIGDRLAIVGAEISHVFSLIHLASIASIGLPSEE